MLSKKARITFLCLTIAVIAIIFLAPLVTQYQDQIRYRFHQVTGQWGNGSTQFTDVAASAGLRYRWTIPGPLPMDILQTIGNGCAFLDYNNSGNLSIFLVGPTLALYQGDGHGHFTDVTHQTGLDKFHGHFLGCAVGDYDNDGYDDIYVSGYGTALLLHNEHGKYFRDVTQQAGLKPQPWGTSCAWGDLTGTGRLDLYVCDYVKFHPPQDPRLCPIPGGQGACAPTAYGALKGVLYENLGNGHFRDVTHAWGADSASGNALGVAFLWEGGSHAGIALANDELPGDLLLLHGARLENAGIASGIAYTNGSVHAGMGLDWGDYDNDGYPDLFVGTFAEEQKPLYHNLQNRGFEDVSPAMGLAGRPTRYLTFGTKWLDYDNSGWLSLILADGHVRNNVSTYRPETTFLQPTLLYHNDAGRHFTDMSDTAGADLARPILGRGLATGDFNNDGRMDVLIADSQGAPVLLRNDCRATGHWITLSLTGVHCNRDAYGALVQVQTPGLTQTRLCHADGSYLSSSDKRVHVGLGASSVASSLEVIWPDGHRDHFAAVAADHFYSLTEGSSDLTLLPSG